MTIDMIIPWADVRPGDLTPQGDFLALVLDVDTYDDHLGVTVVDCEHHRVYLDRQPETLTAVRREAAMIAAASIPDRRETP